MMPKPTLSFTIPSLKDETLLDCRVYIPESLLGTVTPSRSAASSSSEDDALQAKRRNGAATQHGRADEVPNISRNTWRKKAAIIAHPYAPLGGSSDDYIVQEIGGILLEEGFIVGLFNFRGAGNSKGRTSWSGKPEMADYSSFVGFMAVFMHYLDLHVSVPSSTPPTSDFGDIGLSTIPSQMSINPASPPPTSSTKTSRSTTDFSSTPSSDQKDPNKPLLILAGYSYGSLITTLLPPLPVLLTPFTRPILGSTASEIRLRAQHLAETQNHLHHLRLSRASDARRNPAHRLSGIRVGGDELPADVRRSTDGHGHRRSSTLERLEHAEWARRSVERVRSLRRSMDGTHLGSQSPSRTARHVSHSQADREKSSPRSSSGEDAASGKESVVSKDGVSDPVGKSHVGPNALMPPLVYSFAVAYLLISPIQGLLGGLATMFSTTPASALLPSLGHFAHKKGHGGVAALTEGERKLVVNRTLAVFGGRDGFSNVERMRRWARELEMVTGSRFAAVEVREGGHFWHSRRELEELKGSVRGWVEDLEWV